jgi:F0F1-type ATP synthase assembly protein I
MFLISLLLIGLIAVTIITEQESSAVEQEESIPIPVRTDKYR